MIRIKGTDYSVSTYKDFPDALGEKYDELGPFMPLGLCAFDEEAIYLKEGKTMPRAAIHEMLHAVAKFEPAVTESVLSRVADDLYTALSDNGLLVEGWLDKIIDDRDESGEDLDGIAVRTVDRST